MSSELERQWDVDRRNYERLETYLVGKYRDLDSRYSGLKDLDITFGLINCRFSLTLSAMRRMETIGDSEERRELLDLAGEKARLAVTMLEELLTSGVSEDQKKLLDESDGCRLARENLNKLLLLGGGVFFEREQLEWRNLRQIARAVAEAVRKYAPPDDNYQPLAKPEELPQALRRLASVFFPVLAPERQEDPPYGIEEGEEQETRTSHQIKLPLSQAIHYYETELIPALEADMEQNPGDRETQGRIEEIWRKINEYKQLKFVPRATPLVMPHGYYTEAFTQYTEDGELLVTVDVPVTIKSGTNLDRQQDLVKSEVVRRLAGKGVCDELDREYFRLKSLESGRRGSSLFPLSKLNTRHGYQQLKRDYPSLTILDDRRTFARLIAQARKGRGNLVKMIEDALENGADGSAHIKSLPGE